MNFDKNRSKFLKVLSGGGGCEENKKREFSQSALLVARVIKQKCIMFLMQQVQ